MGKGYFLADTNSLVYAYRAGGEDLLDSYISSIEKRGLDFAITDRVLLEVDGGPLSEELARYFEKNDITVLPSPETDRRIAAGDITKKNAGEESMLEVAREEHKAGRVTHIWSDDKYFVSVQIMREERGSKPITSANLLNETYERSHIDAAEYQRFRAGYEAQSVFKPGESPRLNTFRHAFPALDPTEIRTQVLEGQERMTGLASPMRDAMAIDVPEGARSISQAGDVSFDAAQPGPALRNVAAESSDGPRLSSLDDTVTDLGAVGPDDAPRGHPHVRALGAGLAIEAAVTAYEWNETRQRAQVFLSTLDNERAAHDAYARQGAQTAGTAVGTVAGGLAATALGAGSGGTFLLVAGDAYLFGKAADRVVDLLEQGRIRTQKDGEGVQWEFNGRQWLRGDLRADLADDGRDMAQQQAFAALPDKARELSARASAVAVEQVLGRVPVPRDPFVQPADGSPDSGRWEYAADRGVWEREVVTAYDTNDRPSAIERVQADPDVAARLNAQAMQVVEGNLRAGPAVIAAQYEIGHKARGYEQTVAGAQPPAVAKALDPDLLQASDGKHYRRDAEGAWMHEGIAAAPNRALELELGRERLLPALEQHRTQLAGMPTWQPPTPQEQDRDMLRHAYLDRGWNREALPEMFEASYLAV